MSTRHCGSTTRLNTLVSKAAIVALCAVALSACGGSDEPEAEGPSATDQPSASQDAQPGEKQDTQDGGSGGEAPNEGAAAGEEGSSLDEGLGDGFETVDSDGTPGEVSGFDIPIPGSGSQPASTAFQTGDRKIDLRDLDAKTCLVKDKSLTGEFASGDMTVSVTSPDQGAGVVTVSGSKRFAGSIEKIETDPAAKTFLISGKGIDVDMPFAFSGRCS